MASTVRARNSPADSDGKPAVASRKAMNGQFGCMVQKNRRVGFQVDMSGDLIQMAVDAYLDLVGFHQVESTAKRLGDGFFDGPEDRRSFFRGFSGHRKGRAEFLLREDSQKGIVTLEVSSRCYIDPEQAMLETDAGPKRIVAVGKGDSWSVSDSRGAEVPAEERNLLRNSAAIGWKLHLEWVRGIA